MRLLIIGLLALLGILSSLTQEYTNTVFWWPEQIESHSYRIDVHRVNDNVNTGGWFTTNWYANYEDIMYSQKRGYYNIVVKSLTNSVPDNRLVRTNYDMYWAGSEGYNNPLPPTTLILIEP